MLITIDGPAGVGKSTVSKSLAIRLGYRYLDTGALYRALAYKAQQEQVDLGNLPQIQAFLSRTKLNLVPDKEGFGIVLDGQGISQKKLRAQEISQLSSSMASVKAVRDWLLPIQQEVGQAGGIIAEGRDMGTRVFPEAEMKFFLDADIDIRAVRRHEELLRKGETINLETVRKDLVRRDERDRTRKVDPMKPALGAIEFDTSHQGPDEVVDALMVMIMDQP